MAIERITPIDWSISLEVSSHTNISNYAEALTNIDSLSSGMYSGEGTSYLIFDVRDLPSGVGATSFRIKARVLSYSVIVSLNVVYNGDIYSSSVSIGATTATIYDLPLPSGVSITQLKNATAIYLRFIPVISHTWIDLFVYGAEIDIDTTAYKIFNLILPRG